MTKYMSINQPALLFNNMNGELSGENVEEKIVKVGNLKVVVAT